MEDRYGSVSGVSMVPGTFNAFPCFHLHSDALLSQPTRYWSCCVDTTSAVHVGNAADATGASDVSADCNPGCMRQRHGVDLCLLTGTSTLKGCPQTTPSPCCSDCCPTRRRSPSPCGRSWTRTRSRWWDSSWTVSHNTAVCPSPRAPPCITLLFIHHQSQFRSKGVACVCSCRWRKNADVLQQQLQGRVPDGHLRRA